jgi:hypothetical protein
VIGDLQLNDMSPVIKNIKNATTLIFIKSES